MVEGEDEVILIHRKSAVQLQEHFDRMEAKKRMAVMADSDVDRTNRQDLCETMRETRQSVYLVPIPLTRTMQCPTDGGDVSFGMPAPLNPTMLQGAALRHPR